ncbi:MAG: hypothetical protein E7J31_05025 [Clostridium sp.]|uniref:hypothetical protein n=1 Tax=Clostridium sp. TaxID=1506 RepID=UPI00290BA68B|nr:hypothetical protein [Clostridium sp.]MDU7947780.1 hypothetical protein [Clostridium sp.]
MDIIIDGNIQPSDGFMIGATTSQSLDLTLLNKGDMVYGTSTIKVEIGLKIGSTIEYIPMGIYNIDDVEKTDYTIKITAFDNMMKFERNFTTTLGDTLTLQQVASELTRITGVQFTGNLPAYTVKKLEGFSCREVLGYVASVCGGNAIITRDGKFTIVTPKDNYYSIGTSNYFDYKREETKYKIGKISCQSGEEILSKGSIGVDSMELQFENPWVNNTILTDIYTKLNGFEYLGYSMKWQGDPSLDVGDIVTITDKKGVVRKHPILSQKFTYTGGLTAEMGAKGENKNKNEFSGSGPSAKKVERVVMELALINKALIDVAYIGDLTAGNIKFDTASGTIMDLQTLLAKFVTGENGQFLNLTTDNVTISNALIKDVIAKSISVEDLKVGNIDSNRFNIVGTDGNLLIKDNTIQIKDSARVRVQIGKDASGDYSMYVWDKQGNLMFDALGLKSSAIKDKIIRDDMVADNANINGSKLNISSLITEVNKDNTQTLKASRISFDSTGQSLEVSFNSLKSNVDNMEIGGRNLQGNADFNKPLSGTWRYDAQFMSINEEILCDGYKTVKILRTNATTTSTRYLYTGGGVIPAKYGEEFTMSFMYYIPEDVSQEIDGIFQAGVWFYKDRNAGAGSTRKNLENEIVKGKWIKVVVTGKAKDVDTKSVAFVIGFDKNCEVYISKPKLERGNKATDFTVAPEDIEEKIESNTTAITVAQEKIEGLIKESSITKGDVTTLKDNYTSIKATVDGINTTVASHTSSIGNLTTDLSGVSGKVATIENKQATLEQNLNGFKTTVSNTYSTKTELNTAKIDAINSANNSTDNKLKNYSTTIAMNTAITQSANSVKTEVSNTYLSKGDATNTYATKASMELTSTQLRLEFKSSGGGNLLKNGRPIRGKRGLANWYCSNSAGSTAVINLGDGGENLNGEVFGSGIWWNGTRESAGGNTWCCLFNNSLESYKFNKGKTYYVSLIIYSSTSGKNININIVDNNGLNHVGGYNITLNAGYQLVQFNFSPAQAGNKPNLGLYLNTPGSYNFYIPWAVVGEGYPVNNWIPNDNEIEDGNTTIDATGVKIYNGALTVLNNNGQVMLQGDSNGNLSFSGRLQPYDYQIRLFGNDCRIDGSAGAIRMQWNPQNYISVENGATRMYDNNSAGGTRYISFATDTEGHANMWGTQTRMKLLGNSSARPVIQSRNISDNAYGDFHGADFLNRSTIKDKTNIQEINDIDFKKLLMENTIKKYNLKTDVEIVLDGFGLENTIDEVVASSADIRLGFILEELTQDARAMLSPGNMESISIYSMCSILWKVCQEQQKRIEVLENLQ